MRRCGNVRFGQERCLSLAAGPSRALLRSPSLSLSPSPPSYFSKSLATCDIGAIRRLPRVSSSTITVPSTPRGYPSLVLRRGPLSAGWGRRGNSTSSTPDPLASQTTKSAVEEAVTAEALAAARKKAAESVVQEYAALFRPVPQAPKEEFTARVLGAPFDVAFRGTVGVAVAALLILVTFGVAAKLSDAWDVYQLTRRLLDVNIPPGPEECFGRDEDLSRLQSRLGERPEFIYFVTGSPRSGLSTIVHKVLHNYAGNSYLINFRECSVVVYSNAGSPLTGLEDFTHSLNKALGFLEVLPSFRNLKHHFSGWEIKGILIPATEAQRIDALKSTLEKLTKALKFIKFISRFSPDLRLNAYPIICFDHFREVMYMPDSKQTLSVLLKWALWITHEAHLAHVILVSSDPKTANAITNDELVSGRIISVCIDPIGKEPALTYLRKRLGRTRFPRDLTDEEGERIYAEIGSGFLDLNTVEAVLSSAPNITVDQALDMMRRTTTAHIVGALGAEGRSWTPTQLWRTIKLLVESDTGELDYFQLKALVFNGNEKAMFELFDAGILHYRVIPHRPNPALSTPAVAAYTPFVMHCFKQLANDPRVNAIMDRQMADKEAQSSSLVSRLGALRLSS